MSMFIRRMNEDPATIIRSVTHMVASVTDTGDGRTSAAATGVRRIPLNMQLMKTIMRFVNTELDLRNAFSILNAFSLNSGLQFKFADEQLEEKEYGLAEPMRGLLIGVRKWFVMYGFVAVRNPDLTAARVLQQLVDQPETISTPSITPAEGALEEPFAMIESLKKIIEDIVESPAQARSVERRTLGAASSSVIVEEPEGDADIVGTLRPLLRRKITQLQVQHFPAHTSLYMPSARAVPVENGATSSTTSAAAAAGLEPRNRKRAYDSIYDQQPGKEGAERTLQEALIGLRNLEIVNLDDGEFFLEIDLVTRERRLIMMRRDPHSRRMEVDNDVYIHVWRDRMPNDDGTLNTPIIECIRLKERLLTARRNADRADFDATHPIMTLEQQIVKQDTNVDRMTDQEIYGGDDSSDVARQRRLDAEQQAVALFTLNVAADVMNQKRRDQLSLAIAERALNDPYDGVDAIERDRRREAARLTKDDYFPLPPGFKVSSSRQPPMPVLDLNFLLFEYRHALANLLGVPPTLLDSGSTFAGRNSRGGTGGTSGQLSTAAAGIGDRRLVSAIEDDRQMLREFARSLWNIMYRNSDNTTVRYALEGATDAAAKRVESTKLFVRLVMEKFRVATDLAELQSLQRTLIEQRDELEALESRLRVVQERLLEISSRDFRFDVEFTLRSHVPPDQIMFARSVQAITELEMANIARTNMGLDPLTKAEFEKIRNEKEKEELARTDKEAAIAEKHGMKPPKPKIGGGAASKPTSAGRGGGAGGR
jgi:hypothetical protein